MKKLIEKIKGSERPVRKKWVLIFSVIASFLILIVWVIQFAISFSQFDINEKSLAEINEGTGIWTKFSAAVSTSFGQVKSKTIQAIDGLKEQVQKTNDLEINSEEK